MELSRRDVVGVGALAGAILVAESAKACSLIASVKPIPLSEADSRASLNRLVALINAAPMMAKRDLSDQAYGLSLEFDKSVPEFLNIETASLPLEDPAIIDGWTINNGKRDNAPIKIQEFRQLKRGEGVALYTIRLRRSVFWPEITQEDSERSSCGMGAVDAHFEPQDSAYIGTFRNNKLRKLTLFPDWLEWFD